MLHRLLLAAAALFWVTMTVLLWRAEFAGKTGSGTSLPPAVVWNKILTAPDSSSLTIFRQGKKVGFCHWSTSIGEELSALSAEEGAPEGMVQKVSNYKLQFEGSFAVPGLNERARFDSRLTLGTNNAWQNFDARFTLRPTLWEIRSLAVEQTLVLQVQDGQSNFERTIRFSELQDPARLVERLAGPAAGSLLGGVGLSSLLPDTRTASLGLKWEARHDVVQVGHSAVRAYRLQTRVLDRYSVVLHISRVGEILRAELPDHIVLVNDALGTP